MVYISEWMPDPGPKSPDQWIELFNDSDAPVDLSGWHLQTTAKKPVAISGTIGAREYKVLRKADFKFTLRKTEGKLSLLNDQDKLVDSASYHGKAIRYQSVNRIDVATFFGSPTPGRANSKEVLLGNSYPLGIPLPGTNIQNTGTFFSMLLGTALTLAILAIFLFTIQDDLQKLLFPRHQRVRRGPR
jgi:hypothetical protein